MQQHGEADISYKGLLDPEDEGGLERQIAFRAMDAPMHPPPQLPYQPFHHDTGLASTTDQITASNATNNPEPEDPFTLIIDQEVDITHIGLLGDQSEMESQVTFRPVDAPIHPPPQLPYQPLHHDTGLASTTDQIMASNTMNNIELEDPFTLPIDQEADMTHIGLLDLEDRSELERQVAFRAVDAPMHPPTQSLYEPLHHDMRFANTTNYKTASGTTNNPEPEHPVGLTTD